MLVKKRPRWKAPPLSREAIQDMNIAKARAMARMALYDRLNKESRDTFKTIGFPRAIEPDEDRICEVVAGAAGYFDKRGMLKIPGEGH